MDQEPLGSSKKKWKSGVSENRVPDAFQLGTISSHCALLASRKINIFLVFNSCKYSDSPASTNPPYFTSKTCGLQKDEIRFLTMEVIF
jgi:hypothetical protein